MRKAGDQLKATAVAHPWLHLPGAAGRRLPSSGALEEQNAFKDRLCALLIVGLVVVMVAGWVALGVSYVRTAQQEGAAHMGAIPLQHPDVAASQAESDVRGIDIAAWTPVWIGVDLAVFVGLGIFLRHNRGRKP